MEGKYNTESSPHEVTSLMLNNFLGKANITSAILDNKIVNFDVSVSKLYKNDFGFLIEINIEQLFRVGGRKELEHSTSMIIEFCESIFDNAKYSYAFSIMRLILSIHGVSLRN